MRGERKSERLREREINQEREDQSGWRRRWLDRVGLGVEWSGLVVGGGQIGQCIGEPSGARPAVNSIVKIEAQPVLVGAWLAIGNVGFRCLWIGDEGGVEPIFA